MFFNKINFLYKFYSMIYLFYVIEIHSMNYDTLFFYVMN
jgi:hypothetical protein